MRIWDILQPLLLMIGVVVLSMVVGQVYYSASARRGRLEFQRIRGTYSSGKLQTTHPWYVTNRDHNLVYLAGSAGVSLVAVVQLLAVHKLDGFLTISICAFALAIPLLAGEIVVQRQTSLNRYAALTDITALAQLGLLFSAVGVMALFFHLSIIAGILFGVACGLTYGSLSKWLEIHKAVNADDTEGNEKKRNRKRLRLAR
jgi:hypothetical protein